MTYWKSVILVFLGACSYGVLSTLVKLGYQQGFTTAEISGSQMVLGALMLWAMSVPFLARAREKASGKQWLLLMAVGSFAGLTGIFYYLSLQFIPASIAIVLLFQFTWIGVLVESLLERKWPGLPKLAALLLLVMGTVMTVWTGEGWSRGFSSFSVAGITFGLLSALTYTGFLLFSGRTATVLTPLLRSSIMMTGSAVITVLVFPPSFIVNGSLAAGLWLWGLLLALFGAVIPTLTFTYGIPHIGGGLATILGAAELPTVVLLAWTVLHEPISIIQWAGVITILAGIAVAEIRPRTKADPNPSAH